MNTQELDKIKEELEQAKQTISDLRAEESRFNFEFNGVSSELYAKQREVENIKYTLFEIQSIVNTLLESSERSTELLQEISSKIKVYL